MRTTYVRGVKCNNVPIRTYKRHTTDANFIFFHFSLRASQSISLKVVVVLLVVVVLSVVILCKKRFNTYT